MSTLIKTALVSFLIIGFGACSEESTLKDYSTEEIVLEYRKRFNDIVNGPMKDFASLSQESSQARLKNNTDLISELKRPILEKQAETARLLKPFADQGVQVAEFVVGHNLLANSSSDLERCNGLRLIYRSALGGHPMASVSMSFHYREMAGFPVADKESLKLAYFWAREADRRDAGPTTIAKDLFLTVNDDLIAEFNDDWFNWSPIETPLQISGLPCMQD